MQKWEYGFFYIREEAEKTDTGIFGTGIFAGNKYSKVAYLNNEPILKIDISSQPSDEKRIEETAFNILGSMGWELASHSVVYYAATSTEGPWLRKEKTIFKRPVD